jgi:hypothetical protein
LTLDHGFVHVPLAVWPWTILPDAICKMSTKAIAPQPNFFWADDHASRSQQILNVSGAQRKAMVGPNRVSNDLTRKAKAFQARHNRWHVHKCDFTGSLSLNNLAMPW